jgi:Arc/MetJ family transcription regulator
MHRTTVSVDAAAFERARAALGTRGYTDTINSALREVVRRRALQRAAELVRDGSLGLVTPDELAAMRKSRVKT